MERDGEGEVWRNFGNPRVENINREGRTGTFYHGQVGCCSCAFEQEIFLSFFVRIRKKDLELYFLEKYLMALFTRE